MIRERKRKTNTFFKPGRIPRCTVQIVDTTEKKPKHVAKFTVYASPQRTKDAIEVALIEWEHTGTDFDIP